MDSVTCDLAQALRVSDVLTNKKNIPALEAFSFLSTEMYCDALRLLPAQITSINRGDYVKVYENALLMTDAKTSPD